MSTSSQPLGPASATSSRPRGLAWSLLLALAWLPFARLWTLRAAPLQHDLFLSDLWHSHLPYRVFLGRELARGHLPLWMPDVYSGVPYLAQIEAGTFWLPNALLFTALPPLAALDLSILLTVALGAAGAWALARAHGVHPLPAVLAGLAFALGGFNVSHVKHLNMHEAAAMLPWVLWALEHALRRGGRWWPALGAALVVQLAAGHPQITYITLLGCGGRWLVERVAAAWRARTGERPAPPLLGTTLRSGAALAGAAGVAMAIAGVQLATTWAFNEHSLRAGGLSWAQASAYPFDPRDLWTWLDPHASGNAYLLSYRWPTSFQWEGYAYMGWLTLALAVIGAARLPRRRVALGSLAAVAIGVLLVLGPATPLYEIAWRILPGMDLFRFPTRFLVGVQLAVAVLAAGGLDQIRRWLAASGRPRVAIGVSVALVALLALDLTAAQRAYLPIDTDPAWREPGAVASAIAADGGAITDDGGAHRVYHLDEYFVWSEVYERHRGFSDGYAPFRALAPLPLGSAVVQQGLRSAGGYTNMVHLRAAAMWYPLQQEYREIVHQPPQWDAGRRAPDRRFQALLDRAAVRYVIGPAPIAGEGYRPLLDDPPLARNLGALPRAYVASRWVPVDDTTGAALWMFRGGVGRPAVPAIEGVAGPAGEGTDVWSPAAVRELDTDHLVIELDGGLDGWLVVTDSWDRGWTATVDGVAAPIAIANVYQRAIAVTADSRRVELRYRPPGLAAGLALSVAGASTWAGWLAVAVIVGRRRSRSSAGTPLTSGSRRA